MKTTHNGLSRRTFVSAASAAGVAAALGNAPAQAQEAKPLGTNLTAPARPAKNVLLIVGENFEELEFAAFSGVLAWTRVYSFKGTPINVTIAGFDRVIGGMGSLRVVPDVLVGELTAKDIAAFDAVAIPCSVGGGRGRRTGRGQSALESKPVLEIVRQVHGKGGVIATMCCGRDTLVKAGLLKPEDAQCRYWSESKKNDAARGAADDAPIFVSNRIVSTMGPAVAWQAVVVLIELLLGKEQAADFTKTCPWVFGQKEELLNVPVHHMTAANP